ncbi:MAG TPA: FtsX-like permease family protein [Candidatus Acidoferrum sp.]|nr:FtsX-like permease family protein [Candidatus Acidoferrum sp.]
MNRPLIQNAHRLTPDGRSGSLRRFAARLHSYFSRHASDNELDSEIAAHLQFAIEENLEKGMAPQEAERQARIGFGGPQQTRESHRDSRGFPLLESFLRDFLLAFRALRNSPGFTTAAVLTLALGIGANSAIFSVANGVLFRDLPFKDPRRLVLLWSTSTDSARDQLSFTDIDDYRAQNHSLEGIVPFGTSNAAWRFTVFARTSAAPQSTFAAARTIVHSLDAELPVEFGTLDQTFSTSIESRRFSLTLIGCFSLAALLLAVVGVYGVTSYSVTRRIREIGIRMALGASASQVLAMILIQTAATSAIGVSIGTLGSAAVTRLIQSQLFGVSPLDPVVFIAVALLLLLASQLAGLIPGRRASRVDPLVALRYE